MEAAERAVADRVGHQLDRFLCAAVHLRRRHDDGAVARVLARLVEAGPQRAGALAAAVGTDPSTVSRQVSALVAAGLVERRPDPADARAQLIAATADGERCCAEGRRRRTDLVAAVLSGWPHECRHQLAELLGRFTDDLQELDRRTTRRPEGEN